MIIEKELRGTNCTGKMDMVMQENAYLRKENEKLRKQL